MLRTAPHYGEPNCIDSLDRTLQSLIVVMDSRHGTEADVRETTFSLIRSLASDTIVHETARSGHSCFSCRNGNAMRRSVWVYILYLCRHCASFEAAVLLGRHRLIDTGWDKERI